MTILDRSKATLLRSLLLLALGGAAACDGSSFEPTFGTACNKGTLSPGQAVQGSLTTESCAAFHFYSYGRVPYDAYQVTLTKGSAYMFSMQQAPDPTQGSGLNQVDALLTLWGKNRDGVSVPLAVSDDEAEGPDGHDSNLFFVAPTSGTFELVAATYESGELGGYLVEMHQCPVLGTLGAASLYTFRLRPSPCIRTNAADDNSLTSAYNFVAIPVDSFEQVTVTISSDAFTPVWEIFGPGFDTYANIYDETRYVAAETDGSTRTLAMDEIGGTLTLAVGGQAADSAGQFTVQIARAFLAPPAPTAWRDGRLTLKSVFPAKPR